MITPARKEIPLEFTWNRESVFASHEAWEAELSAIQALLPRLTTYRGRLAEGPTVLLEAILLRDEVTRRIAVAVMYAEMHFAVDSLDPDTAVMVGKAKGMDGQVQAACAFFDPELISIGYPALQAWMQITPQLQIYGHSFDNLFRQQEHIRSAEIEELLGLLGETFSNISATASMLTDADFRFDPVHTSEKTSLDLTQGNYQAILASSDREARRSAWENYSDQFLAYKNTLASNLTTSVQANVFLARARRHKNTLEASLFDNHIPVEVFTNLVETFQENLPIWHRYFALRARALKLDDLQFYDLWAPLTEQRPKVDFHQAVEWICDGLAPLGKEYVDVMRRGCLQDRWVDVYPNLGKTSGAFSYGNKGTLPFISLNYSNEIFSMSTLAHELGHSMHSYLTWKNQPDIYSSYSLFIAEVASNFHQAMVRAHLLKTQSDRILQITLLEEAMGNFYRYFFTMPTLARFELEVHERAEHGEGLNANIMIDLLADLYQESYGDAVKVDRARYGIHWASFGHLYSDYYVYQYATGISGAHALSRRIQDGLPGAAESYLQFLRSGSSLYPLDALKLAGVDLTKPEAVQATFGVLASHVDRLESLIG